MARKNADSSDEDVLNDDFLEGDVEASDEWLGDSEDLEGQLAVDVYQTKDNIVIKAPIAGVKPDQIDISVSDDMLTLRGERVDEKEVDREHYYVQECYWGAFSRSIILPVATVAEKAQASLKDGVLTVTIPKAIQDKVKKIKVEPMG
ncbi:MAG TPA: Hsp20/alpha crystallin family protein [Candidatus Saccharimonadales bacterium]|nr:Hsp20/alpha crystallin family protein [Candidatus Saccharimonadales bacterium]